MKNLPQQKANHNMEDVMLISQETNPATLFCAHRCICICNNCCKTLKSNTRL